MNEEASRIQVLENRVDRLEQMLGELMLKRQSKTKKTPVTGAPLTVIPSTTRAARSKHRGWTPNEVGKKLGVSGRTINRRCSAGLIPCLNDGTPNLPRYKISAHVVTLLEQRGLLGVAVMMKAGLI